MFQLAAWYVAVCIVCSAVSIYLTGCSVHHRKALTTYYDGAGLVERTEQDRETHVQLLTDYQLASVTSDGPGGAASKCDQGEGLYSLLRATSPLEVSGGTDSINATGAAAGVVPGTALGGNAVNALRIQYGDAAIPACQRGYALTAKGKPVLTERVWRWAAAIAGFGWVNSIWGNVVEALSADDVAEAVSANGVQETAIQSGAEAGVVLAPPGLEPVPSP
jgi:hypothetical protein